MKTIKDIISWFGLIVGGLIALAIVTIICQSIWIAIQTAIWG